MIRHPRGWYGVIAGLFLLACTDPPVDRTGRDLFEMEAVWQYCKVYSIWHERFPENPFAFDTPEQLLWNIEDTLGGIPYTWYCTGRCEDHFSASRCAGNGAGCATVFLHRVTDSTVLVGITEFGETTYDEFITMIDLSTPYQNIVFDLRDNGGGRLDVLDSIVEALFDSGCAYIEETYRDYNYYTGGIVTVPWKAITTTRPAHPALRNKHLGVLVNSGTASASEILAAAIKDCGNGLIVGDTTYGKGIGQIFVSRKGYGRQSLMITFMRIRGHSSRIGDYHGVEKGIAPDRAVRGFREQIRAAVIALEPSVSPDAISTPDSTQWNVARSCPMAGAYKSISADESLGL